jgi:hypothetical protein
MVPVNATPTPLKEDLQVASAVAAEDRRIKQGLHLMGASEEEIDFAAALRRNHGKQFTSLLGMLTSGESINALKLGVELRRLEKRMQEGEFRMNEKGDPSEERMVRDSYIALKQEFRRSLETCMKGSLTQAKIESMRAEANGTSGKRVKPGFRPKGDTNTQINATNVVIQPQG